MNKIKVIHIVYSFEVGGIETLLLSLLNGLDKTKFDISLISLTDEKVSLVSSLNKDIKVYKLPLTETKKKNPIYLFSIINQLRLIVEEIQPDIIHNHLTAASFLLTSLAIKNIQYNILQIKTIHTTGAIYSSNKISDKVRLAIEKIALRMNSTNIIGVSKAVHNNNIKHFKGIANDFQLIYNGINLSKYNLSSYESVSKEDFGLESHKLVVSYVARLDHGKNHDFLIDLWPNVLDEVPNALLCFAGDGVLKASLMLKVKEKNLQDHIIFLGSITNIPDFLSVTDVAVFPSSFEGFSLVLLEYFAMHLPSVLSNIEPFEEIATDGKNAFIVSLDEPLKFSQKIINLCRDINLRENIGNNAYLTAQRFSIERTIELHEDYYSKSLK